MKSLPWSPPLRLVRSYHARRRLITAGLCPLVLCLLAGVGAFAALAPVAEASVWTGPPGTRVFPNTAPGTRLSISLSLACGEYQGFIVGLRGSAARRGSRKPILSGSHRGRPRAGYRATAEGRCCRLVTTAVRFCHGEDDRLEPLR